MTSGRVLLTGAAGRLGTYLRDRLPGLGWHVHGLDRVAVAGGTVADLSDRDALVRAATGVDAIVHMAGVPDEQPWPALRDANVDGLLNVFEAARAAGVPRVVWASSNHATGFTPTTPELPADVPVRPDTLYGVTKAFGEALGRYFHDRYGLRVASLRIGTCADEPPDERALATWLSPDDCARLVDACLRSDALGHELVWGVSANTLRTWSLEAGRRLGYEPQDDAEAFAARVAGTARPSDVLVGGAFTGPEFGIDEVGAR
ncbi:NAD-dependent epimerase/dehydratase family protein [Jatrophihabitans fulvus]